MDLNHLMSRYSSCQKRLSDETTRLAETENSDLAAAKEDEESRHLLDDLTAKEKELIRANVEASRSIIKAAREAAKVHKELDEGGATMPMHY